MSNHSAVQRFHAHLLFNVSLFAILGFSARALEAQTIRIRLVDGRNGHPMARTCVNVWVGHDRKEATAIPTDDEGIAMLRLTKEVGEVDRGRQWKECGLFGVSDPVLKYEDSVRINVGYVLCQPDRGKNSWLSTKEYSTRDIVRGGMVLPNTCGKANAESKPGELTIFVRPLNWLEKVEQ